MAEIHLFSRSKSPLSLPVLTTMLCLNGLMQGHAFAQTTNGGFITSSATGGQNNFESRLTKLSLAAEFAGKPWARNKEEGGRGALRLFRSRIEISHLRQYQYGEGTLEYGYRQDPSHLDAKILTPQSLDIALASFYLQDPESLKEISAETGSAINFGIELGKLIRRTFISSVASSEGTGVASTNQILPVSLIVEGVFKVGEKSFIDVEVTYAGNGRANNDGYESGTNTPNPAPVEQGKHKFWVRPIMGQGNQDLLSNQWMSAPSQEEAYLTKWALQGSGLAVQSKSINEPQASQFVEASCELEANDRFRIRLDLASMKVRGNEFELYLSPINSPESKVGAWQAVVESRRRQVDFGISTQYDILRMENGSTLCMNAGVTWINSYGRRNATLRNQFDADLPYQNSEAKMGGAVQMFNIYRGVPENGKGRLFNVGFTYKFGKPNSRFKANRERLLKRIEQQNLEELKKSTNE